MPSSRPPLVAALLAAWLAATPCAAELPETFLDYGIEVRLDPATRMLDGRETIRWTNPGSTAVDTVPLHLYLNAFSHLDTTWWRATLGPRFTEPDHLFRLTDDPWGWSEPRSVRQDGAELGWRPIAPDDGNPFDRTLVEVALAEPVGPGQTLVLEVDFEARLPIPIARTGGFEDFFFVAQWFPKIAVRETVGVRGAAEDRWNAHQFHGQTEFYADYADFEVRIGVPRGWAVVATGSGGPEPGGAPEDGVEWHRYRQRAVHDFAFSTGSRMVDLVSEHRTPGAVGPVEVHVFVPAGTEHQAPRWRRAVEASIDVLGTRVAPYPYGTVTVVMPPWRALYVSGMEYPTLFTGVPGDPLWDRRPFRDLRLAEATIAHELVHGYFYGMVGSNEFEEAFLDEGFTEFWGNQVLIDTWGDESGVGDLFGRPMSVTALERQGIERRPDHPMPLWSEPSFLLRDVSIGYQFYSRPATLLRTVQRRYGAGTVDRIFALYFERHAFGHPRLEDFLAAAREAAGDEVADLLLEAFLEPEPPDYRVERFEVEEWKPPKGRVVGAEGELLKSGLEDEESDEGETAGEVGLDPAAREPDGRLMMEVLDSGWTREEEQRPGRIERRLVEPLAGEAEADWEPPEDGGTWLSTVRLEGPGWWNLPVDVVYRFADGATVRETWDGRSRYREVRFLRPAPLAEVRVDPEGELAFDPDPVNNGRRRTPDEDLVTDWAAWLGGVVGLLLEGATQWL